VKTENADIVLVRRDGPVAVVTLNRPKQLNALSAALNKRVIQIFDELSNDDAVRAIVLTGNGRAFCAGIDLKEAGQKGLSFTSGEGAEDGAIVGLTEALERFPVPIIGAINGFAITGGLELALMCDVLLASKSARFADTHARVGVIPGWGLSQKLSRLIGISRAKEMAFTGNFINSERAEKWGLVNRIYDDDALLPAAIEMAKAMCECDARTLKGYKKVIDDGFAMTFDEGLEEELKQSRAHAETSSADQIEAARKKVLARGRQAND